MTCSLERTTALGFGADSAASGKSGFAARHWLDAVTGASSGRRVAGRVSVMGNIYHLVETTPTA